MVFAEAARKIEDLRMGLTVLEIEVGNPAKPDVTEKIEFLIDSGAIYSVVPTSVLKKAGNQAARRATVSPGKWEEDPSQERRSGFQVR